MEYLRNSECERVMSFDFGSLAGIGVNAATGNYLGAAVSAVGLGMSIFGGMEQSNVAKQQAEVSGDIAKQELGINAEKQRAMEIAGRRQQLEIIRNGQRARALAENNAVSQGAQFGSGLAGGLAQVSADTNYNLSGVDLGLMSGRTIAGFNNAISQDKIKLASLGGDAATAAGYTSLGGSLLKAGPYVGALSGGFGKSSGGPTGNNYGYTANTYGNGNT